ncbi:MAG TPA: FimV/HubP family polar landmark protein [Gallionella sp.]|nr:FimV/HubP family polar landmark protein [Gallionella sp.]
MLNLVGVAALTLSAQVYAVGMGGINVVSALGQPLKADIDLVSVSKAEKASLVARLASTDIYKGAGLDYPYGNKFKFQIESRPNGDIYLKVSSAQPVNDPFVSLMVELTWSSGKLLREYTFLLDPPGYVAEQPKPVEVQAVAPAVQAAPVAAPAQPVAQAAAPTPAAAVPAESKPVAKPVEKAAAAPAKPTATAEAKPKAVAEGNITVKRGDTLNQIAAQTKPADVSLERMLVALYRANAEQFDGRNMNRIKTGKILRMPAQSDIQDLTQKEAVKEIHAQVADWNAYRQKLASAAPASSQSQPAQQVSSGKIGSSVADKTPVAKETAKEVLKLSKGEAPGDKAAGQMSAQDKKNAAQEEAIAKEKAAKEEQARAAMLEKNLKDMQRLAELKSQAAALAQAASAAATSGVASAVAAASEVTAASSVAAASQVAAVSAVKPVPVVKPQPKVVVEPTLVEQIMAEPLYLAGGAAALLGLGGLGFMMNRRRKTLTPEVRKTTDESGSITGRIATPVAASPETGDFTAAPTAAAVREPAYQSDDVDPISEADLFLNFGRDAQAEEILKEALQNTPDNHQIHLKLLGIYANRKDVNSFATIARQLQNSGDDEAWQQAAAMGRKLEPNNPMYGGEAVIEEDASATMQAPAMSTTPDFVLDSEPEPEVAVSAVDFDLGGSSDAASLLDELDADKTAILSDEAAAAAQAVAMDSVAMDFDVTSTNPSMPAAAAQPEESHPSLDDLIFDVTATHPSIPAVQPEAAPAAEAHEEAMEFTLDFPSAETAETPAPAADIGLSGISLNLDDVIAPAEEAAPVVKDEHWHEVATKLDLAKAYQEMGDATGAREILDEVVKEGDDEQRETAQALLNQLG